MIFKVNMQEFISKSDKDTKSFAKKIAEQVLNFQGARKRAVVLGLVGDLGAGKTTFTAGFARGLGVKGRVLSPTFMLIRRHELRNDIKTSKHENIKTKIQQLIHVDAYRLNNSQELLDLGFDKILKDPQNIIVVEWADKVKDLLPKDTMWINFKHDLAENFRSLQVL